MKKILLSVALISSMAMASDYNYDGSDYEITPLVGYNFADSSSGLDDSTLYGLEAQYNDLDYILKPELSLLYSNTDYTNSTMDSGIYRMALNGVYEYDKMGIFTPLAKMGVGYENIDHINVDRNSHDGAFLDAGIGAKIDLVKNIALKLEAVYMLKDGVDGADSNFATLAGINYAFGGSTPAPAPEPIVEPTPAPVDGDDDNDGVLNSVDSCPTTPTGNEVDAKGCCLDDDKDGVINSLDDCPTTPTGKVVDNTGCMLLVNLHINFKNNSAKVDNSSDANIENFAQFLKAQPNYTSTITGYTDSRGSKAYNQKLSEKRANSVKDILVEKGVEADRVKTKGMGENSPIADNKTRENRAKNRRIEASLTKN